MFSAVRRQLECTSDYSTRQLRYQCVHYMVENANWIFPLVKDEVIFQENVCLLCVFVFFQDFNTSFG